MLLSVQTISSTILKADARIRSRRHERRTIRKAFAKRIFQLIIRDIVYVGKHVLDWKRYFLPQTMLTQSFRHGVYCILYISDIKSQMKHRKLNTSTSHNDSIIASTYHLLDFRMEEMDRHSLVLDIANWMAARRYRGIPDDPSPVLRPFVNLRRRLKFEMCSPILFQTFQNLMNSVEVP